MTKCSKCNGSGYVLPLGLFAGLDLCPDCQGSGWLDTMIQGEPPKKKEPETVKSGLASSALYSPGDVYESEDGRQYQLSDKRIWKEIQNTKAPAQTPAKSKSKKKKKK